MKLDLLTSLYKVPGPFATAYLDTSRDSEDAARAIDLRWQGLAGQLTELGADENTLDAMADQVGVHRQHSGRHGQALIAAHGRVVLDAVLPQPPPSDAARWSALPDVLPLIAQLAARVPHVVVVADRTGADIGVHGYTDESRTVEGGDYPIRKVSAGGWSEQRYQRSAENLWEHNAKEVADEVDGWVRSIGARLVVLAGDVRARTALREHLSARSSENIVEVEQGGRGEGAAMEPLEEEVARLVAEVAARDVEGIVEKFSQERGEHDRAVEGLEATVGALQRAQVETLIVQTGQGGASPTEATAWTGPEPAQIALKPEDLWQMGVEEPQQVRADAALLRAAAGTGADLIVVVPGQVKIADGIGAVTRFSDAATGL